MRLLASSAAFFALTFSALAMPPVPRKSPDFSVTDPSGKTISLSSFKGKVLVVPFMFTTCPHCQNEAKMLTKLQRELGPGVAVLGAAFNDGLNAQIVNQFVREYGVGFPVGSATWAFRHGPLGGAADRRDRQEGQHRRPEPGHRITRVAGRELLAHVVDETIKGIRGHFQSGAGDQDRSQIELSANRTGRRQSSQ